MRYFKGLPAFRPTHTGAAALLLATTAMTPAGAAEWEINLGGYMEQHLGYAAFDSARSANAEGLDIRGDQEVYVRPSIMVDNGLTFEARVELNDTVDGAPIDDSFVFIDGSFGRILIGSENDYATVPQVPNFSACGSADGNREITYFTPRFAGFQLGTSYSFDGENRHRGGVARTDSYLSNIKENERCRP